jgi:hypothetical protein
MHVLIWKEKLITRLNDQLERIGLEIIGIKPYQDILVMRAFLFPDLDEDGHAMGDIEYSRSFELTADDIEESNYEKMEPGTKNLMFRLFLAGKIEERYKSIISNREQVEVLGSITKYKESLLYNSAIKNVKKDLICLLECIIDEKPMGRTQSFVNLWRVYDDECKPRLVPNDKNGLSFKASSIDEDRLLSFIKNVYVAKKDYRDINPPKIIIKNCNLSIIGYRMVIAYLFIEYLRVHGPYKFKKCPYCSEYFISKHSRRKRCYSKECEKKYQRLKKRKQRELEPEIYS